MCCVGIDVSFYITVHRTLPFSLGASVLSASCGFIITRTGDYRMLMTVAWAVFAVGYGLLTRFDSHSTTYVLSTAFLSPSSLKPPFPGHFIISAEKVLYPLIASTGIGCLFQVSTFTVTSR